MKALDQEMSNFIHIVEKISSNPNTIVLEQSELDSFKSLFTLIVNKLETPVRVIDVPAAGIELDDYAMGLIYLNLPVELVEAAQVIPSVSLPATFRGRVEFMIQFKPNETDIPAFTLANAAALLGGLMESLLGEGYLKSKAQADLEAHFVLAAAALITGTDTFKLSIDFKTAQYMLDYIRLDGDYSIPAEE